MFKPKTVEAAIAPLLKAVVDLEGVADARNAALATNSVEITRLEAVMEADQIELTRAEAVAKMIKAITNPTTLKKD